MKTVKVSIQDENTLILQEDAIKGDIIDLKSIHEQDIDKTTITRVVNSIKLDAFNVEVQKKLDVVERENAFKLQLKEKEYAEKAKDELSKKDVELAELKAKIQSGEIEKTLAVKEAVTKVEKERDGLTSELKIKEAEKTQIESSLNQKYSIELNAKDEIIERYKDMKVKLSTKLLGETLEQHCEIEFNKLRATGFQKASFEKDNDAKDGSKGDYIFREFDGIDTEIVSIMFDMKNESDTTATKKKNEDFIHELDKDRTEKKCEYAVLVSMLEADNELYNQGIVDMSHRYAKMYIIRPQFFIPIITLLRNASLKSLEYKSELSIIKNQNIDVTNFESELVLFQDGFMKNVKDSSSKFQEAMDGIDATIKKLEGIKEALRLSNKHLLTAGNKVETVSVKRLTQNNPTMASKFTALENGQKKLNT